MLSEEYKEVRRNNGTSALRSTEKQYHKCTKEYTEILLVYKEVQRNTIRSVHIITKTCYQKYTQMCRETLSEVCKVQRNTIRNVQRSTKKQQQVLSAQRSANTGRSVRTITNKHWQKCSKTKIDKKVQGSTRKHRRKCTNH